MVVIDLPFEGRKVEGSRKYRRERVPKTGNRREETITEPINSCIGKFHTIAVGKCCLEICVLEVDEDHPVVPPYGLKDRLIGLHLEQGLEYKPVQYRKVYNKVPGARSLPNYEYVTVKAQGWSSRFDSSLGYERMNLPEKHFPLDRAWGITHEGNGIREMDLIPSQILHHPRIRFLVPPNSPADRLTAAYRNGQGT